MKYTFINFLSQNKFYFFHILNIFFLNLFAFNFFFIMPCVIFFNWFYIYINFFSLKFNFFYHQIILIFFFIFFIIKFNFLFYNKTSLGLIGYINFFDNTVQIFDIQNNLNYLNRYTYLFIIYKINFMHVYTNYFNSILDFFSIRDVWFNTIYIYNFLLYFSNNFIDILIPLLDFYLIFYLIFLFLIKKIKV
jgi:hypothetical protein